MSVIAWDGRQLAADKRASMGSLIRTTTKIFRVGDMLAGYEGDADAGEEVLEWFKNGSDPTKFPPTQRGENWSVLTVFLRDGHILRFERTPFPIRFPPQTFAVGSGRDFALAAMHCGKSAKEAVEVACFFDNGCGNGIDVLSHD